jgi:hypothetical protein
VSRPRGPGLGTSAATGALGDWQRRTALAGPPEVEEAPSDQEWCTAMGLPYESPEEDR